MRYAATFSNIGSRPALRPRLSWRQGLLAIACGVLGVLLVSTAQAVVDPSPKLPNRFEARGWPFDAMGWVRTETAAAAAAPAPSIPADVPDAYRLAMVVSDAPIGTEIRIPTRPLWPGFIANALMYAVSPYLLLAWLPPALRAGPQPLPALRVRPEARRIVVLPRVRPDPAAQSH